MIVPVASLLCPRSRAHEGLMPVGLVLSSRHVIVTRAAETACGFGGLSYSAVGIYPERPKFDETIMQKTT